MTSKNDGSLNLLLIHPQYPVLRQTLHKYSSGSSHIQLLLEQHDKSLCTTECGIIAGRKEVTPPRCPTLPLELKTKIKRIVSTTPYFDWDAVHKLVKGYSKDQRKNSASVLSLYTGRVLLSQLDKNRSLYIIIQVYIVPSSLSRKGIEFKPFHATHASFNTKMPAELWYMVMTHLPSVTRRHVAEVFNVALTDYQRHSDIWIKIFKPGASIKQRYFALLGDDLHALWYDPEAPAYLALVKSKKSILTEYWRDVILDSFEAHDRKNGGREIVFKESRITLNIEAVIDGKNDILCEPRKLFSYRHKHKRWRSACLYWKGDEYALRRIGSEDIVGIKERGITYVSHICGITLPQPKEMKLKQRQQYRFEHQECPKCRDLLRISAPGHEYNGDNHLGWERGWGARYGDVQ